MVCTDYRSFYKARAVRLFVVLDGSINLKTSLIMSYSEFISNFKRKE